MESLRSWAVILPRLLRYVFVYRLFRIGACPTIMDCRPECMRCLLDLFHWDRKVRLVDAEQCPRKGPAVFVANHIKRDDPFVEWQAIQVASNGGILPRIMMRDDFFGNIAFLKSRLLDGNELTAMLGSLHISRGRVGLSQIIPFIKVLCEEDSFLMYPSGTRSRSGLFVEYRDGFEEPGAVSLFVAQAQRRRPDLEVAVVPMTRTYNPVTGKSALIFCAPQSLPHGADRTAQRAFDANLVRMMAERVEINVAQVVSGLLYVHSLRHKSTALDVSALCAVAAKVFAALKGRDIDPAAENDLDNEVRQTLRFLAKKGVLKRKGRQVELDAGVVLGAPAPDLHYADANPIKHLVNQVIHLADVTEALHDAARHMA